jgi:hypothetical protein
MKRILWNADDISILIQAMVLFASVNDRMPMSKNEYASIVERLPEARRVPINTYRMEKIDTLYLLHCSKHKLLPATGQSLTDVSKSVEDKKILRQKPPEGYVEMEGCIPPGEYFSNRNKNTTVFCCDEEGNLIDSDKPRSDFIKYLEQYIEATVEKCVTKRLAEYLGPVNITPPPQPVVQPAVSAFDAQIYSKAEETIKSNIEKLDKAVEKIVTKPNADTTVVPIRFKKKILTVGFKPGQQKNLQLKFNSTVDFTHIEELSHYATSFAYYDLIILSRFNGHSVSEILLNRYKVPKEKIVFVRGGVSSLNKMLIDKIQLVN